MNGSNQKPTFTQVINVLGSVTSITGISLLWLKGNGQLDVDTIIAIPLITLIVSFLLGLLAVACLVIEHFHGQFAKGKGFVVNAAYSCLAFQLRFSP